MHCSCNPTHTAMELPSMRVRNPNTESSVTAGGAQSTSSSSTSSGERCQVSFTDLSDSGKFSATLKGDVEGFQRQPLRQKQQHSPVPSQQHLNPLFDLPDTSPSATPDNGQEQKSPMDRTTKDVGGGGGGGDSHAESGGGVNPSKAAFSAIPLALSEKPSLSKRQSTKQLLKPKNALEVEVGSRDTMEKIAIRFRTTPSEICKMNKMASRMIFPGQILFVPDPDASPVTPSPTKEPEAVAVDVMFPAAAAIDDSQHPGKAGAGANNEAGEVTTKMPSLPSLPSFTSVTAITGGVTEASKDAGAAASSQFTSLISKLNPATAISRTSLRKKKNGQDDGNKNNNKGSSSGGAVAAADVDPDQECLERFLKLDAKYITDGRGVVAGTLLVTPNAIMFDPHVMDPLVIEHSAEEYGVMAPMECVMNATLYHDISRMSVEGKEKRSGSQLSPAYRGDMTDESVTPDTAIGGLKAVPTEQRLSVALGEKASGTNIGARRGLGPSNGGSSKESSGSHASAASSNEGKNKSDAASSNKQYLVNATPAIPVFELDDSVFETPGKSQISSAESRGALVDSASPKVLTGDDLGLSVGQIEISVTQSSQLTNADTPTKSTLTVTSQSSSCTTISTATNQSTTQQQQQSRTITDEGVTKSIIRAPDGDDMRQDVVGASVDAVGTTISAGATVWYADLSINSSSEFQCASSSSMGSSSGGIHLENAVDPAITEHLFNKEFVSSSSSSGSAATDMVVATSTNPLPQPPMFLCLKVGQPLNKRVSSSGPIASYAKKKKRPEYWFSIPKDRAPRLYAFFLQWTPEVYDNRDDDQHQQAFVVNGNLGDEGDDANDDDFLKQLVAKEWEIINTDEIERRRSVLMSEDSMMSLMPEIIGASAIFDEDMVKKIHEVLPARTVGYPWNLVFSTEENGFSLNSLYRKMAALPQGPVLMFIKDTNDKVFGAMSSCSFIVSDHFYGNGEMFLFSLLDDGELKHWPWSGENSFFIKGNKESLAIGAGEGLFGLWLDEDLYHGRSHPCSTFGNDCLSSKEDFVIKALEIWAFLS